MTYCMQGHAKGRLPNDICESCLRLRPNTVKKAGKRREGRRISYDPSRWAIGGLFIISRLWTVPKRPGDGRKPGLDDLEMKRSSLARHNPRI